MSAKVMGWVFDAGPAEQSAMVVMLAIADNADDQGIAFPGVSTLAHKTRMSERQVLRVLATLEVEGWLSIRRRSHKVQTARGPVRMGSTYCLNLKRLCRSGEIVASDDTMSLRDGSNDANKEVIDQPSDTVSCEPKRVRRGDKTGGDEVTKTTPRSDISALPILKNHQEPSGKRKTYPTLPRGRVKESEAAHGNDCAGGVHAGRTGDRRDRAGRSVGDDAGRAGAVAGTCGAGGGDARGEGPAGDGAGHDRGAVDPAANAAHLVQTRRGVGGSLTSSDVRAGLDAVLAQLKAALLDSPAHLAFARGANWVPGEEDWQRCFRSIAYVSHEAPEAQPNGLVVTVTSDDPRATREGLAKYRLRVEAAMRKCIGYVWSLAVVAGESEAA